MTEMQDITKHKYYPWFISYHEEKPETYDFLVSVAREAKRRNINRGSIRALIEYARWETRNDMSMASGFCDDFAPLYSRLIMMQEPDLAGWFETRTLHAMSEEVAA